MSCDKISIYLIALKDFRENDQISCFRTSFSCFRTSFFCFRLHLFCHMSHFVPWDGTGCQTLVLSLWDPFARFWACSIVPFSQKLILFRPVGNLKQFSKTDIRPYDLPVLIYTVTIGNEWTRDWGPSAHFVCYHTKMKKDIFEQYEVSCCDTNTSSSNIAYVVCWWGWEKRASHAIML